METSPKSKGKFSKKVMTIVSVMLFIIVGLVVLAKFADLFSSYSGSHKEFVYNEAVTHSYFAGSELFETTYKRFTEGEYLTHSEYEAELQRNQFAKDRLSKDIDFLQKDFVERQTYLNGFTPSASAGPFHKMLESYYQTVLKEYIPALEEYAAISTDDAAQIEVAKQNITAVYDKICDMETKMQKIQLEYIEREGFEPK